jgi:hypothetical protein
MRKEWTVAEIKRLKELRDEAWARNEQDIIYYIACAMGRSCQSVRNKMQQSCLSWRRPGTKSGRRSIPDTVRLDPKVDITEMLRRSEAIKAGAPLCPRCGKHHLYDWDKSYRQGICHPCWLKILQEAHSDALAIVIMDTSRNTANKEKLRAFEKIGLTPEQQKTAEEVAKELSENSIKF